MENLKLGDLKMSHALVLIFTALIINSCYHYMHLKSSQEQDERLDKIEATLSFNQTNGIL